MLPILFMPRSYNRHIGNHSHFADDFCSNWSNARFISLTGVDSSDFIYIYNKYCGGQTPINHPSKLFLLYLAFKCNNTQRIRQYINNTNDFDFWPWIEHLSSVMNEIENSLLNRFKPDNRIPVVFSSKVTMSVDTFPIRITRVSKGFHCYNGKYGDHVMKIQVCCMHTGEIVHWTGPNIGEY